MKKGVDDMSTTNLTDATLAIVEHIKGYLPPLADLLAHLGNTAEVDGPHESSDMGPIAQIPAVYIHILLSHLESQDRSMRCAQLERTKPLRPAWLTPEFGEWPDAALHVLAEAFDDTRHSSRTTHVAVQRIALGLALRYIADLEMEVGRTPSPLTQFQQAAIIRSAAQAIVGNIEGFTGELEGDQRERYVRQVVREISITARSLSGGSRDTVQ